MNTPSQPFGTGGLERPYDPRDYKASSFGSASPTPVSYSTPVPTIYMQNKEPSCGEDMGTQYLNIINGCIGSPEFGWKTLRKIDGLSPEDGSDATSIGKQAQTIGTCDLALLPDNSLQSMEDYASYAGITQALLDNASPRKIANYAFSDKPTFQQIKDAIYQHKAVGLLVDCGDGWWVNGWSEAETCPLKLGNYASGHWILATGFDEQYIYFSNSWSTAWGRQGMGYFDTTYIPHVLEMIVFIPPATPSNPNPPKYQFTQNLFFGITSSDVHALQKLLGVSDTGFYGLQTTMAVYNWQKAHGIFACGIVLQQMRDILNK